MKQSYKQTFIFFIFLFSLFACENEEQPRFESEIIEQVQVLKNPSIVAPLTAELFVQTNTEASVSIRIVGKHGSESDVVKSFPEMTTIFNIPVLGMYPDFLNTVELTFFDANGNSIGTHKEEIQTSPLIPEMPEIEVSTANLSSIKPGFNLVNYFGHNGDFFPQRPFMFDAFGDIRWFLDYSNHPELNRLFFDNGIIELQNGNLVFGEQSTGKVYEIDRFGDILNEWSLQGYGFHHTLIEKPNGNLLVTVNDPASPTIEDVIIELDRRNGNLANIWELRISLDLWRRGWPSDISNLDVDWLHANGLAYSEQDNALIVSGRTQGVFKLSANNELIWILAPHRAWGNNGRGVDMNQYLLTPLDQQGNLITDPAVLDGSVSHPDFDWAWYQHSPILLPNGNLMVFDNGDNRNYRQPGQYSRAVEYKIDEINKTVQQIWSYGENRSDTYSKIVSKVVYHEAENNVLFTF